MLTVPPLRARLDDLPMLIEHMRRQVNARHGVRIDGVTDDALRGLAGYPWPGNVRELEAVLEEAMLLRGRGWLRAEDLALPEPAPAASGGHRRLPRRARRPADARRRAGARARRRVRRACRPAELARAAGVGLTLARRGARRAGGGGRAAPDRRAAAPCGTSGDEGGDGGRVGAS